MKKTEQKIIDAFINIAATRTTENMEYSKITVSEIVEAAQVSKPTFYRHYKNIYFLIDAIKIIKFYPMIEILNAYQYKNDAPPFSIIATQIIPFFFDNQIFFRIMRNSSFDFNYHQYLEKQFYPFFMSILTKVNIIMDLISMSFKKNFYSLSIHPLIFFSKSCVTNLQFFRIIKI